MGSGTLKVVGKLKLLLQDSVYAQLGQHMVLTTPSKGKPLLESLWSTFDYALRGQSWKDLCQPVARSVE